MPKFGLAPRSAWLLAASVRYPRRANLSASTPFQTIVARLKPLKLITCDQEPMKDMKGYIRFSLVVTFPADAVDYWHNARGGLRAQYYLKPSLGQKAERYALRTLWPHIERLRTTHPKFCRYHSTAVRASLLDRDAKVRIYPGKWIRLPPKTARQLLVPRWAAVWNAPRKTKLTEQQAKARLLARRGALLPDKETRLLIKGGWIHAKTGQPLGRRAANKELRPQELNGYGFT